MKTSHKWIDPEDFFVMRCRAGLTLKSAATLLDVTARTVRNWEQGMTAIPYSAYRLLKLVNGYVFTSPSWDGWFVRGDTLYSPSQRGFKPHELMYLSNYMSMARQWLKEREVSRQSRIDAARHADKNNEQVGSGIGQHILNAPLIIKAPMQTAFNIGEASATRTATKSARAEGAQRPRLDYKILTNGYRYNGAFQRFGIGYKCSTPALLSVSPSSPGYFYSRYTLCEVKLNS